MAKKKAKNKAVSESFENKVVFEGTDGKFYSDKDCQNPTDSIEKSLIEGWQIAKELLNETGYPGIHKQYILKHNNTEDDEPIGYIGIF